MAIEWSDPKNWYWMAGTVGWIVFIGLCLWVLWLTRNGISVRVQ